MRIVFVGAGELTTITAQLLLKQGHEIVIIEKDKSLIEELSNELAAGFIHGDGSKPNILREADPQATQFLFCLTGNDQYNIISSLVGRSLGYQRVITRIEDPTFEHVCIELGLEDVIVPDYTIARHLTDLCSGYNPLDISAMIKGDARIYSFVARHEDKGRIQDLDIPEGSKVLFFYRDESLVISDPETEIKSGDEVVLITHSKALPKLKARWEPTEPQ